MGPGRFGRVGWRRRFGGGFFFLEAGPEFLVVLFILVPLVALIKDRREGDDQQEGDEEDHRVKVGAMGFHVSPSVPTRRKIDDDGYNEQ